MIGMVCVKLVYKNSKAMKLLISLFLLSLISVSGLYAQPNTRETPVVDQVQPLEPWMLCPDSFMRYTAESSPELESWMSEIWEVATYEAIEEPQTLEDWMLTIPRVASCCDTTLRNGQPQS